MGDKRNEAEAASGSSGLVLTALQHRLITTALAALSVFVLFALLFLLFRLLSVLVSGFSNVLLPLAVATILAMLLRPLVGFVEERTRLGRTMAIVLLYFLVILVLSAVLWWIIPIIIDQGVRFFRMLPAIYEGLREMIAIRFPQLLQFLNETLGEERLAGIGETVQAQVAKAAQDFVMAVASTGPAYFTKVFSVTAGAAIVPVYLFFFLRSNPVTIKELERQMSWIREDIREDLVFLMRQFAHSIETFFQGQVVVGLIMGILLAGGFSIAGIEFGFALGLLIGLLNIIPYLGTIIGLGTVLPVAYLQP
ncbi:MAG TPA: AI-2E family transporter, partial [Oceanipulchritudo sp.]|nr:AI-2E family transporter [Oceanipulchritudo sp.]